MTQPAGEGTAARPRIAYLTTQYPSISHTFIRREIAGLEALGYEIPRFSVRASAAVVDPADRAEAARTFCCLAQPKGKLLFTAARTLLARPAAALRALRTTLAMHRRSERGLLRHFAYLAEAAFLLPILRRERVRHVHVHFGTNAAAVARLIRRLGGPGYSMTVHGPDEFDAAIGLSLGDKIVDAVFVAGVSHFGAAQLRRWVPYEAWDKIHVVHCTVGESWRAAARPVDPDSRTLVCVGRLSAQKGQLLLVEAFASLLGRDVDARLVLVGDGEMRAAVDARIAHHGLAGRVTVAGWQDEAQVQEHLLAARALVLPSFAEGLPVVIMEALALERPVISTYIAGIPELVRPGENGWLVPAGNVEALAGAMNEALDAPVETLRAMGRAGRGIVTEQHRTETEARKLDTLFQRALEPGGAAH